MKDALQHFGWGHFAILGTDMAKKLANFLQKGTAFFSFLVLKFTVKLEFEDY